jgi:adenylate cyclase
MKTGKQPRIISTLGHRNDSALSKGDLGMALQYFILFDEFDRSSTRFRPLAGEDQH